MERSISLFLGAVGSIVAGDRRKNGSNTQSRGVRLPTCIGLAVKARRLEAGMDKNNLCRSAGIAHDTLTAMEKGGLGPLERTASKVARVFGCTVDDLINEGKELA